MSKVPSYYVGKSGAQVFDVIEDFDLGYHAGDAVAYIIRAGRKTPDPRQDLRKAIAHLERQIENFERGLAATTEDGR